MRKLSVRFTRAPGDGAPVGTLAQERGRVYFEYDADFLKTGLDLSPFRLPFAPGLFEHRDHAFGPLPGLFDDSLPDGWGLLLMDRHFRAGGLDPAAVGPLERLAWLGERTMGALTYHPPSGREPADLGAFDLQALARRSQEILAGDPVELLPQLVRAGGTPGGARPKVLVGFDPAEERMLSGAGDLPPGYEHWIVKFYAREEGPDAGAVEYAYSLMARAAGIELPPTRLFRTRDGARYFGAKRFDRDGNRRCHAHTFGNLIQSNFRVPSADYADLLKAAGLLTRDQRQVLRAYRRMAFNWLAHNRDDHVKNFSFILDDASGDWALAPAYDLLYAPGPGGEHTMTLAGEGRAPELRHALLLAEGAGIGAPEAERVIASVRAAVGRWREFAAEAGVGAAAARRVAEGLPKQRRAARRRRCA